MTSKTIYKWTGIVTVLLIISRITGFLRETAIAYQFGTTAYADAYLMASMLPQILFFAFSDAVKTAFIPVYSQYQNEEDGNAFVLTADVVIGALMLVTSVVLVIAAPVLVRLVAPGFSGETYTMTVTMSRILMPGLFFMGLSGLTSGVLHTKKNFIVPALPAYPSNIIIIVFTVWFGAEYGVVGVAWATIVAFASQFFIQLPAVIKHGIFHREKLLWRHPGIKKMSVLLPPVILGGAALELKSIIDRIFGSLLPEGSIAALNYASRVFMLPNGILVVALLTVLYPTLVDLNLEKKSDEFKRTLRHGIGLITLFVLPMMTGLIVLREPIIRLLFERGAFDAEATKITAQTLAFYSVGLVSMAGQMLFSRAFYALKDTVTPMFVTIMSVGFNVLFNALLIGPLKHAGIALGTALSLTTSMIILWIFLRRKIGPFGGRKLFVSLSKSALASVVMGVAIYYGRAFLTADTLSLLALQVGTVVLAGAALYFAAAYILRIEELKQGLSLLRNKGKIL